MRIGMNNVVDAGGFAEAPSAMTTNSSFRFVARQPIRLNRVVLVANTAVTDSVSVTVTPELTPASTAGTVLCTLVSGQALGVGDAVTREIFDDTAADGDAREAPRIEIGGSVLLNVTETAAGGTAFLCVEYTPLPVDPNGKTASDTDVIDVTPSLL